jgi:hypothetical protein
MVPCFRFMVLSFGMTKMNFEAQIVQTCLLFELAVFSIENQCIFLVLFIFWSHIIDNVVCGNKESTP